MHVCVCAAGYEASEGDGAAGEEPEGTVGETGEVQRAGTQNHVSEAPSVLRLPFRSSFLTSPVHV